MAYHRYVPTFALSAGLRMWIKLIMSESHLLDGTKHTDFKVEVSYGQSVKMNNINLSLPEVIHGQMTGLTDPRDCPSVVYAYVTNTGQLVEQEMIKL